MMATADVLVKDTVYTASFLIQTGLLSFPGAWVTPHETCFYAIYVSTIDSEWRWMKFFPYDNIYNGRVLANATGTSTDFMGRSNACVFCQS